MVVGIFGEKRTGKGIVGVGLLIWLLMRGGYSPFEACGNSTLLIEGYTKFKNAQMRELLTRVVSEHVRGKVFYVAEADRAFPPRYWHRPEQTDALIGLQQEQKQSDWMIYDSHFHGVDVLLEDATQIFVYPKYIPDLDLVICSWFKNHSIAPVQRMTFHNVSKWIFPYCITEEPVD